MAIGMDIFELESKIGYRFADVSLLECALTHSSYTNEQRVKGINAASNERLEFLGDAILEMFISEYLFNNFKKYREGALTKLRQQLVCEKTLAKIAKAIDIGKHLNLGNGEERTDCRCRPKVIADALEALIAAVYLDSKNRNQPDDCKAVIIKLFECEIHGVKANQKTDYKTLLQQLIEQDGSSVLEYRITEEQGPEHNKLFKIAAIINNNVVGVGTAQTKKDAEMLAAKEALSLFGVQV